MADAFIVDGLRTPIGSFGGSLASVRPDDLAALVVRRLLERHPSLDPERIDDVILGSANQAGEDNRNVARMSLLLAGLPVSVPGITVNRLCASGLSAVAMAAASIKAQEGELYLAGGVESMTRAPYALAKSGSPWGRDAQIYDTSGEDTELRKQVIFALSQNRSDEAVTKMIDIARREQDDELRKQAIFWLGQSGDARAVKALEEIINRPM